MNRKNFWAFMGVSALIFALALSTGGCNGSKGGEVSTNTGRGDSGSITFSGHRILIGASGRTDSEMSELLPPIRNIITDSLDISKIPDLDTDGLIVSSRDIIFLEDASKVKADDIDTLYRYVMLSSTGT